MAEFLEELSPSSDIFRSMVQRINDTIVSHRGSADIRSYSVLKVYQVNNPTLWRLFQDRKCGIARDTRNHPADEPVSSLFHGTSRAAAQSIARYGFQVANADPSGMFGKGIYFANKSSKSNQYAEQVLLLCDVVLGRKYCSQHPMNGATVAPRGYHSVEGQPSPGRLIYPEYVIYHDYQAYPKYVVEYQTQ